MNGFTELYREMARTYFSLEDNRAHSRTFYTELLEVALATGLARVEAITGRAASESLRLWHSAVAKNGIGEGGTL